MAVVVVAVVAKAVAVVVAVLVVTSLGDRDDALELRSELLPRPLVAACGRRPHWMKTQALACNMKTVDIDVQEHTHDKLPPAC